MTAEATNFIYDHQVRLDESCRVSLQPQSGDTPGKPRKKKNSALCQMIKDKDTAVSQAVMFQGVPRTIHINIREMTYLLQNPSEEPLKFTLTYHLRTGHHIDPNGGPKPAEQSAEEAVYVLEIKPGAAVRLDVADRDH